MYLKISFLFITLLFISCGGSKNAVTNKNEENVRYNDTIFSDVTVTYDVQYGKNTTQGGKEKNLIMDIYTPANDTEENRHLVILAHGGGFFGGNKDSFKGLATYLAKSGYVVASISYRLLDVWPSHDVIKKTVLNAVYDMKSATRFFKKDAATVNEYRINPNTIFVGGFSAGAFIGLNYAYVNTTEELKDIGGQKLLDHFNEHGGFEGDSGNEGYSSDVFGVINISGALFSASYIDENEPMLFSIHATDDKTVPYLSGSANNTGIITDGSGLLHEEAQKAQITNALFTINGGSHRSYSQCDVCDEKIRDFLFKNLKK